jgi:SAM-dependent methyltransferase
MRYILILYVKIVKKTNWLCSGIAQRITRWTGKSSVNVHPKHLLESSPEWLEFFSKEDVILDIGCNNGQRDFRLSSLVKQIVAFDYNDSVINDAIKIQKERGLNNIRFQVMSAEDPWPFQNESFDGILFLDVIEHLYKRDFVMRECFRVLKKGGKIVVAAPNTETPWKKFQKSLGLNYYSDPDHKIEYSESEFRELFKNAGFTIESLDTVVYDFPLVGVIDLIGAFSLKVYGYLQQWKVNVARKHPHKSVGFLVLARK